MNLIIIKIFHFYLLNFLKNQQEIIRANLIFVIQNHILITLKINLAIQISRVDIKKMTNKACEKFIKAQRGSAQGLAWSFPNKETLKPQLYGYKHAKLEENEVRVKVLYFGVGDMDVQLLKAKQFDVFVPGHQVVGIIEAIGQKVGMRKIGDVVGIGFLKDSCKNCKNCWSGRQQLCRNAKNPLTISPDIGGFGTHIQVSADWTFPIPKNIPLSEAAPLFCAGVTAFNVVSSQFQKLKHQYDRKLRICVLGMGAIGHMAVKFAHQFGYQVTVFSHTPQKQQILRDNGVKFQQFFLETPQNYKKNQLRFDVVVISGDVPNDTVKQCVKMSRRNGKICLISYFKGQVSITGGSLVHDQRQIKGIKTGSKDHFYKMLELISHEISQKNNSLLPICEHYNFMDFEKSFDKIKLNLAKFRGVVKVDDDILEKYNKSQI